MKGVPFKAFSNPIGKVSLSHGHHEGRTSPDPILLSGHQRRLNRIRAAGQKLIPQVPQFVAAFYEWLRNLPEYKDHFSDPARLSRVQKFTADY